LYVFWKHVTRVFLPSMSTSPDRNVTPALVVFSHSAPIGGFFSLSAILSLLVARASCALCAHCRCAVVFRQPVVAARWNWCITCCQILPYVVMINPPPLNFTPPRAVAAALISHWILLLIHVLDTVPVCILMMQGLHA
jgi:hypothetical protein